MQAPVGTLTTQLFKNYIQALLYQTNCPTSNARLQVHSTLPRVILNLVCEFFKMGDSMGNRRVV